MNIAIWVETLFGKYNPIMTDVWLPIESVDPLTGAVYISSYVSEEVVASGLASFNLVYLIQVIVLLGFCVLMSKYLRYALHPQKIL